MGAKPVILAVDDTPENLDVVKGLLVPDYQVRVAPNGQIGLKIAQAQHPDLILLDVMMPGIDGYEVCRQLKANPETATIPVIFLTAKTEVADEAAGFQLGASDYIAKPINPVLLKARVETHLKLKQNMDSLEQLSAQLAAAKEKMEDELSVGQKIQLSMLPAVAPQHDNFRVAATMRAARQVGGDLYDYFFINPRHFCICVADISDKGVPASLFMAVTKTLLRANTLDDSSTASIVTRINDQLARDNEASMFATIFIAIVDLETGVTRYTNGGHNRPFIRRASGEVESIPDLHGPVAGAMDGIAYGESELCLSTGDTVLLYTDGVSEAMTARDELFGEAAIGEFLERSGGIQPSALVTGLIEAVDKFADGFEQSDDITLLAFTFDRAPEQVVRELQLSLTNNLTEIDRLNDSFNELAESADIPIDIQMKVNLVFDELINNVISYGLSKDTEQSIQVGIALYGNRLVIEIEDGGIPFNPFMRADPNTEASLDEREIGGLGIHLVKELMDEVSYKRAHDKNRVTLVKQLYQA